MEGLNFEEQQAYHPTERVKPIPEMPALTRGEIKDIRRSIQELKQIEEMKPDDKKNPHWSNIDPDKLSEEDLYAYKKVFSDEDNYWKSERCEEFKNYDRKISKSMEKYRNSAEVYKDPRYAFYEFLKNYLVGKAGLRNRAEKNKGETIH